MKKLYIEPSSKCNLNCKMCFRYNWIDRRYEDMTEKTFNAVYENIKNISSIETVFFGGMGEPLIHKNIVDMVSRVSLLKHTELLTNGTLLTPFLIDKLLGAGLSTLWVSIDGIGKKDDFIRKGSKFYQLINNLKYYSSVKKLSKLGITFVVMKENLEDLKNLNAFLDEVGADLVNVSHAIQNGPQKEEELIYSLPIPVGKMRRVGEKIEEKPYDKRPFVETDSVFIRWDGEVLPCMQLLHETYTYLYEEKRKISLPHFGNVNENSLSNIYNNEKYVAFRKNVKEFNYPCCTICMGCEDRLENKKDCMYNDFPTCGACVWSQGKIFCP